MNKENVATLAARSADQSLQDAYGELNAMRLSDKDPENETKYRSMLADLEDCHNWLLALGEFK